MSYRTTARRLEALEAQAAEETGALYDTLLQALTDDELERRAAQQRPTHHDYTRLRTWLEDRRASLA